MAIVVPVANWRRFSDHRVAESLLTAVSASIKGAVMRQPIPVLAGVLLIVGWLPGTAIAQPSRVPPSGEGSSTGRTAVVRGEAERSTVVRGDTERAPAVRGGTDRPAAVRGEAVRPTVERAAVARVVQPPSQSTSEPPRVVAVEPDRGSRGGSGGRSDAGRGGRESSQYDGDRRGDGRRDGDRGDDRRDGQRHKDGRDGYSDVTGGIVINPVIVEGVSVGGVRLSPTTTIGKRIVIGGVKTLPPAPRLYPGVVAYVPPDFVAYDSSVSYESSETIEVGYVARGVDEPIDAEPVDVMPPPRVQERSLASLGAEYSFRPWYAVSEFVMAGYPLPYPERFAVAYDKATITTAELTPAMRSALEAGTPLVPYAAGTFGGVTFQISPVDAAVFVNGVFVGLVEDFTPGMPPLPLPVGTHRIELRADGFRIEAFDAIVTLNQVTPLSGILARVP